MDRSNAVQVTKKRTEKQLAAVIELSEYSAAYLEPFEIAWINHIISNAIAVVADDAESDACIFQPERSSRNQGWLHEKLRVSRLRSRIRQSSPELPQDQLKLLLNTAKALNSAISLLSCCYDRWCWLKSSKASEVDLNQTTNDLKDFLDWRRQTSGHRTSSSVSDPRQALQPSAVDGINDSGAAHPRRPKNEDSEVWLSLFADGTIEKWRQNAEDALNATTARVQGELSGSLRSQSRKMTPSINLNRSHISPASLIGRGRTLHSSSQTSIIRHSNDGMSHYSNGVGKSMCTQSTFHDCPIYSGTTKHCCSCKPQSPKHVVEESTPTAISLSNLSVSPLTSVSDPTPQRFQRSLENSYEKEPISADTMLAPQNDKRTETIQSLQIAHRRSASNILPRLNAMNSQTTITNEGSIPEVSSESNASISAIFSQSLNQSTVSFQSRSSDGRLAHRSRGRIWLEHQLESEGEKQHSLRPR